jgi:mannobiose 2-epimerase
VVANHISTLRLEMQQELESLLSWWMDFMVDEENGGFYGRRGGHNQLFPQADKGIILNTRILWTFAATANYTGNVSYQKIAERAFAYFPRFWDDEQGGVFWMLDHQGNPNKKRKQIYAQAFAIYALAEFHTLTENPKALRLAQELFQLIEKHSRDAERGGYLEALGPNWEPIEDLRLSEKDANEAKTMNTHLHLMEAYSKLYRITQNKAVGKALKDLIQLFLERFIDPQTGHLQLFFDENWEPRSGSISFGHDIECSWLLMEAIELVEDKHLHERGEKTAFFMADATFQNGLDWDKALINEKQENGQLDREKVWWPQAEAVIGFWNAWQLSGDLRYQKAAFQVWHFIKSFLRDKSQGEWFWSVDEKHIPNLSEDRAGPWKGPYHNVRMCLEILQRTENH